MGSTGGVGVIITCLQYRHMPGQSDTWRAGTCRNISKRALTAGFIDVVQKNVYGKKVCEMLMQFLGVQSNHCCPVL